MNPLPAWSMPLLMLFNADSLRWDLWLSLTTDCPGWQPSSSQAKLLLSQRQVKQVHSSGCTRISDHPAVCIQVMHHLHLAVK